MSIFTHSATTSSHRGPLSLAGEIASSILLAPFRFYENRQLLGTLAGMSEHELSDIGLTRQDLSDTTALPVASKVGSFLSERAASHRRHR